MRMKYDLWLHVPTVYHVFSVGVILDPHSIHQNLLVAIFIINKMSRKSSLYLSLFKSFSLQMF